MEIVDTHMHLWTPETHPWVVKVKDGGHPVGKFESILTYMLDQYKKDITGYNVVQAIHVEACWPGDPVGETKWLDVIADADPQGYPHAIVGNADLSSDNVEDVLKRQCESKRMRGIRHMLNYHPQKPQYSEQKNDNFLTDPKWLAGVALLEKYNLSFELHVLPHQMKRSADVAEKFPNVRFMVDHCGLPYERDDATMAKWREGKPFHARGKDFNFLLGLKELAKHPNVFCKISGVFATDPSWDKDSVASVVLPCIEIFTIDRCVFASNFPVDRINGTFDQLITTLNEVLKPYSEDDKRKLFADNARKFYRL